MIHSPVGRRGALGAAVGAALVPLGRTAHAQGRFPDKPIRMIVPWAPGGSTDVQMRALSEQVSKRFGRPVVVENRPGAGGILGAQMAAGARPDGYLLTQLPISALRYPHMVARPLFDPMKDLTYISQITGYLFGVVVRADAPWRTFGELLDAAKAKPGHVTYGSPGPGTSLQFTMEEIAAKTGVEWLHVPFKGASENLQALLAGTVQVSAESSAWAGLVRSGQFRLLCTWGPERATRFPDAPTLKELGFGIVSSSPYGICGPAGMDPAVVQTLDQTLRDAVQDPAHVAVLERYDMLPAYLGSADYAAAARRQYETDGEMIRRLNLSAN